MKPDLQIIKIGGQVLDDAQALSQFLKAFSGIPGRKILVHGGGKAATELAGRLGVSQVMWKGRRITDEATLKIAVMTYAGRISKELTAGLQKLNVNAMGLCGADLDLIRCTKRLHPDVDFGFVGDIAEGGVNTKMFSLLLENGITPVMSAITHDGAGQLLNTNADTIASTLAVAMSGEYEVQLNFCFEKKGVLRNAEDEQSCIPRLNLTLFRKLEKEEAVSKGMLPKLENSFRALKGGVKGIYIGDYRNLEKMIARHEDAGTEIVAG